MGRFSHFCFLILSVCFLAIPAEAQARRSQNTLTYMSSQDWVKKAELDLGKRFEQETGIRVEYEIIPSEQYQRLLKVRLYTTEMPDIFGNQSGDFDIVSLLDIEKNGTDLSREEWVSRLDPLAKAQVSVNGKVYGFPFGDISGGWGIVYNKKIFERLKLPVPETYAQLREICGRILRSGVVPFYECLSDGWHHVLWFPELGGKFEQDSPGLAAKLNHHRATFAQNQTMLTVLGQLRELFALGYFGNSYASNTYADTEKSMASGKYAMTVGNLSLPSKIEAAYPESRASDFGFFVIPLADNQILSVNPAMPSKFIYSKSKNGEAAKKYFAFLARPENLQYLVDHQPDFLTLPYQGAKGKASEEVRAVFQRYTVRATAYQTQVKYLNPQWMDIGKDMTAMIFGNESPSSVLANIDARRAEMARMARDPAWATH